MDYVNEFINYEFDQKLVLQKNIYNNTFLIQLSNNFTIKRRVISIKTYNNIFNFIKTNISTDKQFINEESYIFGGRIYSIAFYNRT